MNLTNNKSWNIPSRYSLHIQTAESRKRADFQLSVINDTTKLAAYNMFGVKAGGNERAGCSGLETSHLWLTCELHESTEIGSNHGDFEPKSQPPIWVELRLGPISTRFMNFKKSLKRSSLMLSATRLTPNKP